MADVFDDAEQAVRAEVKRLHVFFENWFRGTVPKDSYDKSLADRMHDEFEMVPPSGGAVKRGVVLDLMRGGHGTNPDFRIEVRDIRVLGVWPEVNLIHATYIEAQYGASNSATRNDRRSTALFEVVDGRLVWRHVQETDVPVKED